jgi:predicted dehydrogenase
MSPEDAMHMLMFLAPAHFHAALTLRERHPLVSDEIMVYASDEAEVREFLDLLENFNARPERPTRWRPELRVGVDPLERLLAERPGDLVVVAGRNDRKLGWIRRLHDAGLPVLADKPWMAGGAALDDLRQALAGPPLAMEMMTGRHEITTAVERLLVAAPDVFGDFARDGAAAIVFESVHHLEKRVNGAPLRRPPWYFDVRVQGDGLQDIPTHLVDHAQRLVSHARQADTRPGAAGSGADAPAGPPLQLVAARCWPTRVSRELFARVTGVPDFPSALADLVGSDGLPYFANAQLTFRCGDVLVETSTRWELTEPAGGGDAHRAQLRGTRAEILVEQSAATGWRRRLLVIPRRDPAVVEGSLRGRLADWQAEFPGLGVTPGPDGLELSIPPALRTPHESQFPRVLDEFLGYVERKEWPAGRAAETLAKYELLAEARALAGRS